MVPGTQAAPRKPKTQYTFGRMSRTAAAQATAQKTKVIDMTGPQARVLDSYAGLGGPRKPVCNMVTVGISVLDVGPR